MPLRLTVDPENRVVISSGWGLVSDYDLRVTRRLLAANKQFDPNYDRIWDLTGATRVEMSDDTLKYFAARSLSNPMVKRAIVCIAPGVVPRVLDFVSECRYRHQDVSLFPTLHDAARWLKEPDR